MTLTKTLYICREVVFLLLYENGPHHAYPSSSHRDSLSAPLKGSGVFTARRCNTLQHTLQHTAAYCDSQVAPLRGRGVFTATHCSTLQRTLQHT